MSFRTNYKDEIPQNGKRLYNIIDDKTGAVINQNARIVRSNSNTQEGDEFGAAEVNLIHKHLNSATNDNLIMNPEFKIWQRGETFNNVANGKYTADRWRVYKIVPTDTVNVIKVSNGLKITGNITGEVNIYQCVDKDKYSWLIGKKTMVTECVNGVVKTYERIQEVDGNTSYIILASVNKLKPNDVINYVKVEPGEVVTPYVSRPYEIDLLLCQSKYVKYRSNFSLINFWSNAMNDSLMLDLALPMQMDWMPTITVTSGRVIDMSTGTAYTYDKLNYTVMRLESNHIFVRVSKKDGTNFNSNNWVFSDLSIAIDKEII